MSIVSDSGSRHYLAPGEPASVRGELLAVSILPETDCYLYAIFTSAEGSPPIMLWPSPALRAVECLPQNRITELVYDSAAAHVSITEGTLTLLLLTTFPADLHTALTGKKSDQGRILREIRTLFQRYSAYAEKKETGMVLIAGNVRTEHSPPQGIQVDREKFWGGGLRMDRSRGIVVFRACIAAACAAVLTAGTARLGGTDTGPFPEVTYDI